MKHIVNLEKQVKKDDSLFLSTNCRFCKDEYSIEVNKEDFNNYQKGELIQNAFPYLSSGHRELFISHTCDNCWDKLFGL